MKLYGLHFKAKYKCFPGSNFETTSRRLFKSEQDAQKYEERFKTIVYDKLLLTGIMGVDSDTIETTILDYEVD